MDYQRVYNQIIDRAKAELRKKSKAGTYYEAHHIIPKCIGGEGRTNQHSHPNIVLLNAREHFLCHWLLYRLYPDNNKISYAFFALCNYIGKNQKRYVPGARAFKEAREAVATIVSKRFKGNHLSDNHKRVLSEKIKGVKKPIGFGDKISAAQKGREGTHKGFITVTNGIEERRIKDISICPAGWKKGRKNSVSIKNSLAKSGCILSIETKEKMSNSAKKYRKEHGVWNKGLKYNKNQCQRTIKDIN